MGVIITTLNGGPPAQRENRQVEYVNQGP